MIGDNCPRDTLRRLKSYQKSILDRIVVEKHGNYQELLQLTFDETGDTPVTEANLLECMKMSNFPMMRYVWGNLAMKGYPVVKNVVGWIGKAIDYSDESAARWLLHQYHQTLQA